MDKNFKKNTIWNIVGTTLNAFNSLFLMIIVTRINGVNDAGIFTFAFSTATLFNVIGVYAGRVYQVTDKHKNRDKEYLMNRIISCAIMIIVSIIFIIIRKYNFIKQLIIFSLCFLKMLEAFADVLYAFFQKNNCLYQVGISLTMKTLLGLIVFFITDYFTHNLILSIILFIAIYILCMIFYDFRKLKIKSILKKKANYKIVKDIFISGFPTFCFSFLTIYLINASKYAIDSQMSESIQAIFGIIIMPATIMILIAQFVIHPFLVLISNKIEEKKYRELIILLVKISLFIFLIGIIAIIGCKLIGIYILELIYNLSLYKYSFCLSIILLGATFYALTSILNTVLIAMRHTLIQMIIYAILAVIALISSSLFVSSYGILGASWNYLFIMGLSFISFLIVFIIILTKSKKEVINK